MPFYLRKSVSLGPFRFKLSKSGIGVSAGVWTQDIGRALRMSKRLGVYTRTKSVWISHKTNVANPFVMR